MLPAFGWAGEELLDIGPTCCSAADGALRPPGDGHNRFRRACRQAPLGTSLHNGQRITAVNNETRTDPHGGDDLVSSSSPAIDAGTTVMPL